MKFSAVSENNKVEGGINGVTKSFSTLGVSSKYSLEYLKKLFPLFRIFKKCTIKIGKDYPLLIECKDKESEAWMILAPRVDND